MAPPPADDAMIAPMWMQGRASTSSGSRSSVPFTLTFAKRALRESPVAGSQWSR